jgi:hypothetical protein
MVDAERITKLTGRDGLQHLILPDTRAAPAC